jgi:hypothetical protein
VVEHLRGVEQVLGDGEGAVRIARQQHALGEVGGRAQVDGAGLVLERHSTANPSEGLCVPRSRACEDRVEDSGGDGKGALDTR